MLSDAFNIQNRKNAKEHQITCGAVRVLVLTEFALTRFHCVDTILFVIDTPGCEIFQKGEVLIGSEIFSANITKNVNFDAKKLN